jgi:hypothetical protein
MRVVITLMYRVLVVSLLTAIVGFLVIAVFDPSPDTTSLNSDLGRVREQIEDARQQDEKFSGGAIKALIQLRLNMLHHTEALLEQKNSALLRRVWMHYTVDGHPVAVASNADLDAIIVEIEQAEEKLKRSTLYAEQYSGGLIQAMALMTAETDRMSVAQLRLKFYSAKHGLPVSVARSNRRQNHQHPVASWAIRMLSNREVDMRVLVFVALISGLAAPPLARAQDADRNAAPFGLIWTMSAADTRSLGVDLKEVSTKDFGASYVATKLSKILSDVENVFVSFGYEDKLWRVAAISKPFKNDPSGISVRARYDELGSVLAEKYGKGRQSHFQDTTMWKSSTEFVMGIKVGRSSWFTNFETNLLFIQLGIIADDSSTAQWRIIMENKPLRIKFEAGKKAHERNAL